MRLIDADALIDDIKNNLWDWDTVDGIKAQTVLRQTITDIGNAPTVDAVPVRHGRWMDMKGFWMCSECHKDTLNLFKYCPYCGAKMDEEE